MSSTKATMTPAGKKALAAKQEAIIEMEQLDRSVAMQLDVDDLSGKYSIHGEANTSFMQAHMGRRTASPFKFFFSKKMLVLVLALLVIVLTAVYKLKTPSGLIPTGEDVTTESHYLLPQAFPRVLSAEAEVGSGEGKQGTTNSTGAAFPNSTKTYEGILLGRKLLNLGYIPLPNIQPNQVTLFTLPNGTNAQKVTLAHGMVNSLLKSSLLPIVPSHNPSALSKYLFRRAMVSYKWYSKQANREERYLADVKISLIRESQLLFNGVQVLKGLKNSLPAFSEWALLPLFNDEEESKSAAILASAVDQLIAVNEKAIDELLNIEMARKAARETAEEEKKKQPELHALHPFLDDEEMDFEVLKNEVKSLLPRGSLLGWDISL